MICKKCYKDFNPKLQPIEIRNRRKILKCPFCKTKYEYMLFSDKYIRLPNGQLINKVRVPKMSKKERLKKRRGQTQKSVPSDAKEGDTSTVNKDI